MLLRWRSFPEKFGHLYFEWECGDAYFGSSEDIFVVSVYAPISLGKIQRTV
jgi:hypothetical protein